MGSPPGEEASRSGTSPSRPPEQDETVQPSTNAAESSETAAATEAPDLAPTQQTSSSSPPPPPFEPLFTLLTNASTNTTIHPRVHYVFSDDDDSAILSAEQQRQQNRSGDEEQPRRALVVDLVPNADNDAWAISCASSLSPAFAVTATDLAKQQSGGGAPVEGDNGNGALMLRVEGVSREPMEIRPDASLPSSGSGSGAVGTEDVESLAEEFRRRMGILKKVVGESEKRTGLIHQKQQELDDETRGTYERTDEGQAASDNDSPGGSRAQQLAVAEES